MRRVIMRMVMLLLEVFSTTLLRHTLLWLSLGRELYVEVCGLPDPAQALLQ